MKSSTSIELGPNDEPVIRIKVRSSYDIKDTLFQQFQEIFEYENGMCICGVCFDSRPRIDSDIYSILEITPLNSQGKCICYQRVEEIYNSLINSTLFGVSMSTIEDIITFYNNQDNIVSKKFNINDLAELNIIDLVKTITEAINELVSKR